MSTRRTFMLGTMLAGFGWLGSIRDGQTAAKGMNLNGTFAALERDSGGRLGVTVLDTATGEMTGFHQDDRFPMCSTFKLLVAGAVLKRVDTGKERLDRIVPYTAADLVTYSPSTGTHAGRGLTVGALCEAAVTLSDNTAANLLLASIGGPPGLTAFARSLGDDVTRLDRIEPALNEATPGDPRDTTTPLAMAKNVQALTFGGALTESSRAQLIDWLIHCKTGDARLRAGAPGWRIGDKTGTGGHGTANDIGVLWPPSGKPLVVAVYLTETNAPAARTDATIAAVARAVTQSAAR